MLFGSTPFYERGKQHTNSLFTETTFCLKSNLLNVSLSFAGIDQKGLFRNIVRGNWSVPKKAKVGDNAISMISGMLERKPTERLGCLAGGYRDIKNHPWMKEVNFVKLVMKQIKVWIVLFSLYPFVCLDITNSLLTLLYHNLRPRGHHKLMTPQI